MEFFTQLTHKLTYWTVISLHIIRGWNTDNRNISVYPTPQRLSKGHTCLSTIFKPPSYPIFYCVPEQSFEQETCGGVSESLTKRHYFYKSGYQRSDSNCVYIQVWHHIVSIFFTILLKRLFINVPMVVHDLQRPHKICRSHGRLLSTWWNIFWNNWNYYIIFIVFHFIVIFILRNISLILFHWINMTFFFIPLLVA